MKKLLLAMLMVCLLVAPAHAEELTDQPIEGEANQQEQGDCVAVSTLDELQAAIAAANDGDTIFVNEVICIGESNICIGDSSKTIELCFKKSNWAMMVIQGKNVTLKNAILSGNSMNCDSVINIADCGILYMENVTMQGFTCDIVPISNSGNTLLKQCKFSDNSGAKAGHIWNNGTIEIYNSTFSEGVSNGAGGGINCEGNLTIVGSQFNKNCGVLGGAIYSTGYSTISNCCIVANHALRGGGGICNGIDGGRMVITDCEIYDNNAVSFADDICNISCMTLQYTKSLEDIYVSTDRIPYNWMKDSDLTRNGVENSIVCQLPIESDYDDIGELDLKFVFEDELSPSQDEETDTPNSGNDGDENDQSKNPSEDSGMIDSEEPPEDTSDKGDIPTDVTNPPQDNSGEKVPPQEDGNPNNPPEKPSEPPEIDNTNEDDTDYRPIYRPVRPIITVTETQPEQKPVVNPVPAQSPLVCNGAAIDTSRTIVLLGYGDGLAHENDPLTRAQLATIIYRLLEDESIDKYSNAELAFTDVATDAWYAPYVRIIQAAGIVNGVGDGKYNPNGTVTWAQIVTILTRFVEQQNYTLRHIQYNGWAQEDIQTAVALGWIEDSVGFDPNAIITRGELVQLINFVLTMYK